MAPDTPRGPKRTNTYVLIEEKLKQDPVEFIRSRRGQDPPMTYAKIAREIFIKTGVDVTQELPRRWLLAADGPEVSEAAA